jgi:hypothetical protein
MGKAPDLKRVPRIDLPKRTDGKKRNGRSGGLYSRGSRLHLAGLPFLLNAVNEGDGEVIFGMVVAATFAPLT